MNDTIIQKINYEVYRRFPEVEGARPKILEWSGMPTKSVDDSLTYLLTYQGSSTLDEGKSLPRLVRVVVNQAGDILKITTSR